MSAVSVDCCAVGELPCKRKLELCRSFTESGRCVYGDNCFFAHGLEELIAHQPQLRKKMCRNFHQHKFCRFGSRCNFVHECGNAPSNRKPKSMVKMMEEYPEMLTALRFRKTLLALL
jgi:hypothetical protein